MGTHSYTLFRIRSIFSLFSVFRTPTLQDELIAEGHTQVRKIIQAQLNLAEAKSRLKLESQKLHVINQNLAEIQESTNHD